MSRKHLLFLLLHYLSKFMNDESLWTVTLMCLDSGVCWGKTKWSLFPDRSLDICVMLMCWSRTVRGLPVTFSFTQLKTVPPEDHRRRAWSTQRPASHIHTDYIFVVRLDSFFLKLHCNFIVILMVKDCNNAIDKWLTVKSLTVIIFNKPKKTFHVILQ